MEDNQYNEILEIVKNFQGKKKFVGKTNLMSWELIHYVLLN